MDGLIEKDDKTPHTVIQYFEDGEREETPRYGAEHYKKIETVPEDLNLILQVPKEFYIFKNSDPFFWRKIIKYKEDSDSKSDVGNRM